VLAGRGFVPSALGRRRASTCRHNDRHVRCSQDGDRTARVTPVEQRKVSAPRLGRPYRIERSGLSPEAWPDAEPWGPAVPLARATVERRQASALCKARAAPAGAAVDDTSVGVLLPCFFSFVCCFRSPSPILMHSAFSTAGASDEDRTWRRRFWEWRASWLGCEQKTHRENGGVRLHLSPPRGERSFARSAAGEGALPRF